MQLHHSKIYIFFNGGRLPFLRIRLEFTCNFGISIQETVHFISYYKNILQFEYCWDVRLSSIVTQHVFVIKKDYSKDRKVMFRSLI